MWKPGLCVLAALLGIFTVSDAWAQENDPKKGDLFRPEDPQEEDDALTPEQAMQVLREIQDLMRTAAELLNDSARGKAIEADKDVIERLEKLLKEDKETLQKSVVQKIERLMRKAELREKQVIEKLQDLIKRARD